MRALRRLRSKIGQVIIAGQGNNQWDWEHYNRITFIIESIKNMKISNPSVLDVGGATGNNLLHKFGIKDVVTLDIDPKANITASADNIPLKDNAFDIVTCIDTFEHIPEQIRERALCEIVRVASKAAFLVAPVKSDENNRAEQLVLKYLCIDFIKQHQVHGLVDFNTLETIAKKLQNDGRIVSYDKYPLDNLLNWVTMMTRGYVDNTKIYKEAFFLENGFHPKRIALSIFKSQLMTI